jgi:hypothetical protein
VKVVDERVRNEVEGKRQGSYRQRRKAVPSRSEGALPEPAAPNLNRRAPLTVSPNTRLFWCPGALVWLTKRQDTKIRFGCQGDNMHVKIEGEFCDADAAFVGESCLGSDLAARGDATRDAKL